MGHWVRGSPAHDRVMEETGCFSSNAPSFFGSMLSVPMQPTQPGWPQVPRKAWSQLMAGGRGYLMWSSHPASGGTGFTPFVEV